MYNAKAHTDTHTLLVRRHLHIYERSPRIYADEPCYVLWISIRKVSLTDDAGGIWLRSCVCVRLSHFQITHMNFRFECAEAFVLNCFIKFM